MRPFIRQRSTNPCFLCQMFHPGIRLTALAVLGTLGLWLVPLPGGAQIPDSFATVGPAARLAIPPPVRVVTVGDNTRNDPTAPAHEMAFRPTMDQSVYDALKAEANAAATPAPDTPQLPGASAEPSNQIRLVKNFEGVNQTLAFGPGSGFFPPDTHGAISTTQFVEIVITALVVYDRDSGLVLKRVPLNQVFGYPVPPGQFIGDPRVAYDRAADRFVITGVALPEAPDVQFFFIAVSETPDATGAFLVQRVNVRQPPFTFNAFFDFPNLGIGTDAVFVTGNIFAPAFVGADLVVFPKAPLYAGQGATITVFTDLIGTLTPPIVLDQNGSSFLLANLPNTPFVAVYELTGAGDPTTTTLADPFTIVVPTYRIPRSARQAGVFNTLDTLDTRFVNASTQIGTSLFNVHTIALDTFPTPRWYELNLATHAVAQTGVFFGTQTSDDWNASLAVNDASDVFVTWSSSNPVVFREGNPPSYFAQVRTSGRLSTDPAGVIPSGVVVFESTTPYFFFRWGDYSATTLDPNNANCSWGVNEKINAAITWGSRFFSSCLEPVASTALATPQRRPATRQGGRN
jgi:hypothetical protein